LDLNEDSDLGPFALKIGFGGQRVANGGRIKIKVNNVFQLKGLKKIF